MARRGRLETTLLALDTPEARGKGEPTYDVERDRRVVLRDVFEDVGLAWVAQHPRPGERVYVLEIDGYRREVTRDLARLRPRRDDALRRLR